jgi:hypothetical protein
MDRETADKIIWLMVFDQPIFKVIEVVVVIFGLVNLGLIIKAIIT